MVLKKSSHFNFAKEDAVPDEEFNKVLWGAIKGKNTPMPAPVHSAFVKVRDEKKDDD